jgi:hypothetical protein
MNCCFSLNVCYEVPLLDTILRQFSVSHPPPTDPQSLIYDALDRYHSTYMSLLSWIHDFPIYELLVWIRLVHCNDKATGWMTMVRFATGAVEGIFFFATASKSTLGSIRPPFNPQRGLFHLGWSGRGVKLTTHLHLVPSFKNVWSYTCTPHTSSWRGRR